MHFHPLREVSILCQLCCRINEGSDLVLFDLGSLMPSFPAFGAMSLAASLNQSMSDVFIIFLFFFLVGHLLSNSATTGFEPEHNSCTLAKDFLVYHPKGTFSCSLRGKTLRNFCGRGYLTIWDILEEIVLPVVDHVNCCIQRSTQLSRTFSTLVDTLMAI